MCLQKDADLPALRSAHAAWLATQAVESSRHALYCHDGRCLQRYFEDPTFVEHVYTCASAYKGKPFIGFGFRSVPEDPNKTDLYSLGNCLYHQFYTDHLIEDADFALKLAAFVQQQSGCATIEISNCPFQRERIESSLRRSNFRPAIGRLRSEDASHFAVF